MTQILELAKLVDQNCMTKVQVRRSRVKSGLNPKGTAFLQLFLKLFDPQDFLGPALDNFQCFCNFHFNLPKSANKSQKPKSQAKTTDLPDVPGTRETSE